MNIYAQLWFDTEDFITPEADDALYELLLMFSRKKTPVTFKIVGEKARMLERRGRTDVINLLRDGDFEIGFHTDLHSVHPTISEYCETMGFAEGRDAFYARENPARLDVERIFGKKCICFGQPGNSWASQIHPALRKMGIPLYMDSHSVINGGKKPYWFGGLLNYLDISENEHHRMNLDPDGMKSAREEFEWWTKKHADDPVSFLNIYYHPCEFSCTEFYDLNFARGKNPPREKWIPAKLRPKEEMIRLVEQISEFVDFLKEKNVKLITASELLKTEKSKKSPVTETVVKKWAKKSASGQIDYLVEDGYSISAIEGLSLVSAYLMKKPLNAKFAYGAEEKAESSYTDTDLRDADTAYNLAEAVYGFFEESEKCGGFSIMPNTFEVNGQKFSPEDTAVILSRMVCNSSENPFETPINFNLVPTQLVTENADWSSWIIHTEDFTVNHILDLAKRQMWTYKPSIFI